MSYIERILSEDERLLSVSRLHWIYVAQGVLGLILFVFLGLLLDHFLFKISGGRMVVRGYYPDYLRPYFALFSPAALMFFSAGLTTFLILLFKYLDTEIVLTNRRLVYKRGVIRVELEEVDIDQISAAHVHHGLLGYFLGYGKIHLDCRFVEDVYLPAVQKPLRLVKAINNMRSDLTQKK